MDGSPSPKSDLVTAVVLLLVAGAGGWAMLSDPNVTEVDYGSDPGPGLLPLILLALLGGCSLVLGGLAIARMIRREAVAETIPGSWKVFVIPVLLVATLLAYTLSMEALGFVNTTAVFALLWAFLIGVQEGVGAGPRQVALYVVEGALITAGVYAVFAWLIKVPLP